MGFEDRDYSRNEVAGGLSNYSMIAILIAINALVFIADAFSPKILLDGIQQGIPVKVATGQHWLTDQLALSTQHWYLAWTWLTHGFAHASIDSRIGFWHIGGNMLALFFLGRPIEERLGRFEFLKFYLLAILAGGAGFFFVKFLAGWPASSVLGASGAVSAVVALFIFYYPRQTLLIWGILPVPAWLLGVLMLLSNLSHALNPSSSISWEAHLAGAAFGVAYYYFGWNFSNLKLPEKISNTLSGGPALKIHNPGAGEYDHKLQQQADAILEKINLSGESSLTGRERKVLKRYSESLRRQRQDS